MSNLKLNSINFGRENEEIEHFINKRNKWTFKFNIGNNLSNSKMTRDLKEVYGFSRNNRKKDLFSQILKTETNVNGIEKKISKEEREQLYKNNQMSFLMCRANFKLNKINK